MNHYFLEHLLDGALDDVLDIWARYFDGSPSPAKSSTAERVDFRLCWAFRFLPMLVCRRTRRFQVTRVFEAMAGGLIAG
jgi:hypothetical protein